MISYSEFLEEGLEFESYIDLVEEWTHSISNPEDRSMVAGHDVSVRLDRDRGKARHYSAEFSVDDQYSRSSPHFPSRVEPSHSRVILHHVHKKISEFVRDKKPKAIYMRAYDSDPKAKEKKQKMYNHFAHHLARKHGGEAWVEPDGTSVVHFNRGY